MEKLDKVINFLIVVNSVTCEMMLSEEGIKKLIEDKDVQFDLVIMEAFFNECFLGFVHKFKAPLIQVCTFAGTHYMGDWFGNSQPYSYVPDVFTPFSDRMDFWQRFSNTITGSMLRTVRLIYLSRQDFNMKKHFGFLGDLPTISEIEYNTSVLLLNDHFSIGFPKPLMPGMVQVGALHVKEPKKLPQVIIRHMFHCYFG